MEEILNELKKIGLRVSNIFSRVTQIENDVAKIKESQNRQEEMIKKILEKVEKNG